MSLIPGFVGNYFRKEYYCLTLAKCAPDVCIEFGTIINQPTVELGRRVYIGLRCSIGECVIEDDAIIGSNVDIISGKNQHNFERTDVAIREQGGKLTKIVIGGDSWIGNSAVVMAERRRKEHRRRRQRRGRRRRTLFHHGRQSRPPAAPPARPLVTGEVDDSISPRSNTKVTKVRMSVFLNFVYSVLLFLKVSKGCVNSLSR